MERNYNSGKDVCEHYMPDYTVGFKMFATCKGNYFIETGNAACNLVFMLEGACQLLQADSVVRHAAEGDLFFLSQPVKIKESTPSKTKMLILTFNNPVKKLCENFSIEQYGLPKNKKSRKEEQTLKLTTSMSLFAKLTEKYLSKNIFCPYLQELKQKELFMLMGREYTSSELISFFQFVTIRDTGFRAQFLDISRQKTNVREFAQKFNMSYSCFLRKFKSEFHCSIQEWLARQKAKQIKMKLVVPSTTISDIIEEFGFTDGAHLNRYCRKQFACTPLELAKQLKAGTNLLQPINPKH